MGRFILITFMFAILLNTPVFAQSSAIAPKPLSLDEIHLGGIKIGDVYNEQLTIKNFGSIIKKETEFGSNNKPIRNTITFDYGFVVLTSNNKIQNIGTNNPKLKLHRKISVGDSFFNLFKAYGSPEETTNLRNGDTGVMFKKEKGFRCRYSARTKSNKGTIAIYFDLNNNGDVEEFFIESYGDAFPKSEE